MNFGLFTLYACFLWVLAIVLIVNDINMLRKSHAFKKEHDLSSYTMVDYGKNTMLLYLALIIFAVISFVINEDFDMKIINVAIFTMALCELVSVKLISQLYYNDKEIVYEGEVYRIKSLMPAKKVRRFGKNHEISTFDGRVLNVNQKVATIINGLIDDMKEEKQARKKKK